MSSISTKSNLYRWAAFLLLATLVVNIMIVGRSVIIPLVFAGFIAVLFSPVSTWLENKLRFPRWLASLICLILALTILGGIITFFSTQTSNFSSDLETLGASINKLIADLGAWVNETTGDSDMIQLDTFEEALGALLQNNSNMITDGLAQATASLIQLMLFMTFVVSFLIYRDELLKFMLKSIKGEESQVRSMILKVKEVVRNYIIGIFLVILVLAFFNSIALLVMGIEHAIFFAVFAAVLNIVPFIGPLVGSLLPAIFALVMKDSLWYPFGVLLYFIVIQSFESYLITPNIVGRKVSINPMFTILAIFVGNMVWGVAGMILFIPFTAMLKQIFDEVDSLKPYGYIMGGMGPEKKSDQ